MHNRFVALFFVLFALMMETARRKVKERKSEESDSQSNFSICCHKQHKQQMYFQQSTMALENTRTRANVILLPISTYKTIKFICSIAASASQRFEQLDSHYCYHNCIETFSLFVKLSAKKSAHTRTQQKPPKVCACLVRISFIPLECAWGQICVKVANL